MSTLPTYEQLDALPVVSHLAVGEEHLDTNGHMNIRHYFDLGGLALWNRSLDSLGMPPTYIAERGLTTFTAEQHLRYFGESTLGDELSVAVVVLDHGDKSLHLAALIVNRTRQELACVMESILVHVDYATRRPVPFPEDVATVLDAAVAGDRTDWPVPISGSIGVRR